MNAILRLFLGLAALVFLVCRLLAEPPAAATGKVLVIDADRLLEGDIQRLGNKFRIRSGGGEMTVPAMATMVLVADREAAYQLVKARFKPGEPLERVKLARWCLANQFSARAIEEAEAALALVPGDRSLKAFRDDVKLRAALAPPPSVTPAKAVPRLTAPEPAVVDVNPESLGVFVTKVQPLLMNACAQCHVGERSGAFRLVRGDAGDKKATQANLAAASEFLNREQPSASPLLVRAVSIHGDSARPPLRDRQVMAFRYLEEWTRQATGRPLTPSAPPATLPSAVVAAAQPLPPEPKKGSDFAQDAPAPIVLPALGPAPTDSKVVQTKVTEIAKPESPKEPMDPFDPALFNQQNTPPKP